VNPTPLADAIDEARYGGKAASLARTVRAGLPVPPGFALDTTAVEAICAGDAGARQTARLEFDRLAGPCAVRSSAVGEDSEHASFAGQHLTVLNVRHADDLESAVLQVRESARTESAMVYRVATGLDASPRVAVVVQRMLDPECAGVMFTRNPVNGADERIVEAAWGLGEVVVGGLVVPDNYVLDAAGQLVRRTIGDKDMALRLAPQGGTVEEPLPPDRAAAPCLDERMLGELLDLGARCEHIFGSGLDIEWAFSDGRLYLLQCRAMTRNR
jgi:pyruvate, water dikinase